MDNKDIAMFWLKLDENFFKEQPIMKLERINNIYPLAYLKACIYSLRFNGYIVDTEGNDLEPWFVEYQFGVESEDFFNALLDCGLVKLIDDRLLISHVETLRGKITKSALRKRRNKES